MYRQGDVLLRNAEIPQSAQVVAKNKVVLAEGEVTGHYHIVKGDVEELALEGERYLRTHDVCQLTHDEHDTITVPPGDYKIIQQREYSPAAIRQVLD